MAQDVARGERLFETCRSCHSLDSGKAGMAGPHLAGLNGRTVGSAAGFDYSPALKAAGAQGVRWDAERLAAYLADPEAMFRGSWMSAPGLGDPADRAALAAFLMQPR
ncbi:cytochrome c family protein [Bosea caraganae]|uniref:Cytochrome c family protein n=2 Tax=Bosea caraganae TaxID=2763117 RepID=A0A370L9D7_9HYPH|nr:cytochrome c family protein [Bosea caraganae]RDJ26372.1 cytochrome c family protein [Bosea caraganae]